MIRVKAIEYPIQSLIGLRRQHESMIVHSWRNRISVEDCTIIKNYVQRWPKLKGFGISGNFQNEEAYKMFCSIIPLICRGGLIDFTFESNNLPDVFSFYRIAAPICLHYETLERLHGTYFLLNDDVGKLFIKDIVEIRRRKTRVCLIMAAPRCIARLSGSSILRYLPNELLRVLFTTYLAGDQSNIFLWGRHIMSGSNMNYMYQNRLLESNII
jgi:hypothetical protein